MKCADMRAIVEGELEQLRARLHSQIPDLVFVGLVVCGEECDAQPGFLHVETQITTRPDFPLSERAGIMDSAAQQVRTGEGKRLSRVS